MTTTVDTPETAALDYLVRIAEAVPGATSLAGALRDFASALHVEGALAGLTTMAGARAAAATIAEAVVTADDAVAALRIRAAAARAGCWDCAEPDGLAQVLDAAATVWDRM
ncbi:hypothetical protein A9W97_19370 [Mycobacterium gordonae]|nr:hypothetical protein [Mycobacterium gordonae]OBJ85539.1 hypothetical protein A9W97_19370 [Mycobacterium gordonae]